MTRHTRILFLLICVVVLGAAARLLGPGDEPQPAADRGAGATTPAAAAGPPAIAPVSSPAPASGAGPFQVIGGRVHAHLDMPLSKAVATLAGASGISLAGGEQLADNPVRVDLDDVPAAEALLRLTAGYDSAFQYQGTRLVQISIRPQVANPADGARQTAGISAEDFDRTEPQLRGDAIENFALRGGPGARDALAHALADPDEAVRLRALEQTQVVRGLALPADELQKLLRQDASEDVRLKALDVLATDPGIDASLLTAIAQGAQSDPSELVRMQALALSRRLESPDAGAPPPAVPEGEN